MTCILSTSEEKKLTKNLNTNKRNHNTMALSHIKIEQEHS